MIKRKQKFKKGLEFDPYILQRYIASGGNGEVWVAKNVIGQDFAIKLLTRISKKSYNRFVDEVKTVGNNSDIEGLLPIISFHLPKDPFTDIPYYVMPLATPLFEALKNSKPLEIVEYFVEVADILAELHNRNISHRDIKPANLLFYKDRIHLSDFGLVGFPDKKDITKKRRRCWSKVDDGTRRKGSSLLLANAI